MFIKLKHDELTEQLVLVFTEVRDNFTEKIVRNFETCSNGEYQAHIGHTITTTKYNSLASIMKWSISLITDRMGVGTTVFNEILCNSQMAPPVVT